MRQQRIKMKYWKREGRMRAMRSKEKLILNEAV
jgi:hypothetical protein